MLGSKPGSADNRSEEKRQLLVKNGEVRQHLEIDKKSNALRVEGHSCTALAEVYGTPLFIISENAIRDNYRKFYNTFRSMYREEVTVCVGMKANYGLAIRKIIAQEGGGGDAFGGGEIYVALLAGTDPKKIVVNGPNKSNEVLLATVQSGVNINVDSYDELLRLNEIAGQLDKVPNISLRIRLPLSRLKGDELYVDSRYPPPGVDIVKWESEFKFGMEPSSFFETLKQGLNLKNVHIRGIMYHGGIPRRAGFYKEETEEFMDYVGQIKEKFNWEPEVINLGGGFSSKRFGCKESPPSIEKYARTITSVIKTKCRQHHLSVPKLFLEPGRWCLENSTIYLTQVGSIKNDLTLANKKWIYVDGNVNHVIGGGDRYLNYHHAVVANKASAPVEETVDICGELCGAGDILAEKIKIPKVERGDLIAFLDMGAYCESHAKQSNAMPRPASVMVNKHNVAIARERETIQDVLSHERCPFWLL